jgi:hypothetical protein
MQHIYSKRYQYPRAAYSLRIRLQQQKDTDTDTALDVSLRLGRSH